MPDIFVSRPTVVGDKYEVPYKTFEKFFNAQGFSPRRLGQSDYSLQAPLKAVIGLMNQCKGALILGYPYHEVTYTLAKGGDFVEERKVVLATPWNQIEGALAFQKGLPTLVVAHNGVEGGLFDYGVTGEFVYKSDLRNSKWFMAKEFIGILDSWRRRL